MMKIAVLLSCFLFAAALKLQSRSAPKDKAQLAVNDMWQEELETITEFMHLSSDEVMEVKRNMMPEDADFVDAIERTGDQRALQAFEPSERLISHWLKASKHVALKESESAEYLPDKCKKFIRQKGGLQSTWYPDKSVFTDCAEPAVKSNACGTSYEIPSYRLGDFFFLQDGRNHRWMEKVFPNSIGAKYIHSKKRYHDFTALKNIIDSDAYADFEKPDSDTAVVHVRGYDIFSMEQGGARHLYVKNTAYYQRIASLAKEQGLKNVVIVTGDHLMTQLMAAGAAETDKKNLNKQRQADMDLVTKQMKKKLDLLQETFSSAGLEVKVRNNMNADCDFVFMANAKTFVPSGGNFDKLAKEMVRNNNGTILSA